ncbi:hypothetical protein MCEZE4_01678 [Burkholderiaceae bacterium]|jgi:hypothetical protein
MLIGINYDPIKRRTYLRQAADFEQFGKYLLEIKALLRSVLDTKEY